MSDWQTILPRPGMTSWQCTAELKKNIFYPCHSQWYQRLVSCYHWTVHHPSSHLTDNTKQHFSRCKGINTRFIVASSVYKIAALVIKYIMKDFSSLVHNRWYLLFLNSLYYLSLLLLEVLLIITSPVCFNTFTNRSVTK